MPLDRERRPRGRARAWAAATAIAAVALSASVPQAMALPANFWGVVPQATPSPEQYQRLKRGGVDSVRIPIGWSAIQPVKGGPFDWSGIDALVGGAAMARLEVLPFVGGAPAWAVPTVARWGSPKFLPVRTGVQRAGWREFLRQAVLRYGPNGSFWAENPAVPRRPLRTWQIWNEQNFMYFVAQPNPREYGELLKISYPAIRGLDPGAKLVLGGLFSRPSQAELTRRPPLAYFAADFLAQMYKQTPGIRSKFHGVALHPYTGTYKRLGPYIEEVRRVMKANRDAGKGLWITELGWSSQPPATNNSFAKGRQGQVTQLKGAFGLLKRHQAKWRVQRVYWFAVDDYGGICNFCDGAGLFGAGFAPKPSWNAYVRFAGGRAS